MKMKLYIIFGVLLLALSIVNAATTFSTEIDSVETPRGVLSNNMLHITNCDELSKPQQLELIIDINYPSDCRGQFDVYVKYYDYATDTHYPEILLCTITGDKKCNGNFKFTLGGRREGVAYLSNWGIFRGVCRYTNNEYVYELPLTIVHTPTDYETSVQERIETVESNIEILKKRFDECKCCGNEMIEDISEYNAKYNMLKKRLASCDLVNLNSDTIQLNNEILEKIDEVERIKLTCSETEESKNGEETVGTETPSESELPQKQEIEQVIKEETQKAQSVCPTIGLVILGIAGLGIAQKYLV